MPTVINLGSSASVLNSIRGLIKSASGTISSQQAAATNFLNVTSPALQTVEFPLTSGILGWFVVPHNLGRTPVNLYWTIKCTSPDSSGIAVGQEVSLGSLQIGHVNDTVAYCDAINVYGAYSSETSLSTFYWNGGAVTIGSYSNFSLCLYYR